MSGHALETVNGESKAGAIEAALVQGDLSKLSTEERVSYYMRICDSLGLSHLTVPFQYIVLNNKLTLYATRACTDALRKLHNVSINIVGREQVGDIYVVTARATMPNGRVDESTGAVALGNLRGEALANAFLKCETKSKRRVTLSICGLGLLDETEVADVPGAIKITEPQPVAAMPKQSTGEAEPDVDEDTVGLWAERFLVAETTREVEMIASDCKSEVRNRATLLAISKHVNDAKKRVGGK